MIFVCIFVVQFTLQITLEAGSQRLFFAMGANHLTCRGKQASVPVI